MTSYETEHNINPSEKDAPQPRRRPDLSTFLSSYNHIDTSHTQNANATPTPGDIAAVVRNAAEWFAAVEHEDGAGGGLADQLREELWRMYEHPPEKINGVSEEFIADLDRVPKDSLKSTDTCPICNMPFLEDPYPLVVRLPCHKTHMFDLECLQPWVKLHNSCPLDRKELEKKKKNEPLPTEGDEEEDYDEMYA